MHMKTALALLCLALGLLGPSWATEQIPDKIIHGGQTNDLYAVPLESYFTPGNPKPDWTRPLSTACWRGYQATWQIRDKQLLLVGLNECHSTNTIPLVRFFPDAKGPVKAVWFNGIIRSGSGVRIHNADAHRNQREHEWYFRIEKGQVLEVTRKNPLQLKVVAYNIKHGRGMDKRVDLERVAAVLKATDADLIALQEVDKQCTRSGKVDIAKELGTKLGMEHRFGHFMDFQGGQYGLAILSRLPVQKSTRHQLPEGAEPRCALEVQVAGPDGLPLSFVSIHNDWTDDAIRVKQVRALVAALAETKHAVVLAGDFNATREQKSMGIIQDAGWHIAEKQGAADTFPSVTPRTEIDFIAIRGMKWDAIEHRVIDERLASDHRPIEALIRPRWRDQGNF